LHQYFETPYLQYRERDEGAIGGCYDRASPNVDVPYGRNTQGNDGEAAFNFRDVFPVLILIVLGVVVLIEPRILLWLVAFITLIVMEISMLVLAKFVRKV